MDNEGRTNLKIIRAAGGLLWRQEEGSWKIAIVHRPRYDDWSLPKGKLKPGETWLQAAMREVLEETGFSASPAGFAGAVAYTTDKGPKAVRYWHMIAEHQVAKPIENEISELVWFSRGEALKRLQYPLDQALLEAWEGPGLAKDR